MFSLPSFLIPQILYQALFFFYNFEGGIRKGALIGDVANNGQWNYCKVFPKRYAKFVWNGKRRVSVETKQRNPVPEKDRFLIPKRVMRIRRKKITNGRSIITYMYVLLVVMLCRTLTKMLCCLLVCFYCLLVFCYICFKMLKTQLVSLHPIVELAFCFTLCNKFHLIGRQCVK